MPNQSAREEKRAAKHLIRHAYALIYIAPLIDPNYPSFRCTITNRSTPNHSIIWNRATADMTEMNLSNERAPMPALVSVPISNIDNTVSDIVHYSNKQIRKASSGGSCQPPPGSGSLRLRLDCRQPPRWIRRASRRSPRPPCPTAPTRPPGPSAPGCSGSKVRPPSSRAMRPAR